MKKRLQLNFLNLTLGLEHLILYSSVFDGFVRFQSSYLEQKQFERFLQEVDNNILMLLALGNRVCIYDFTSRKMKNNSSRACWQGIPWIKYCINRAWFKKESGFDYGMHYTFKEQYEAMSRPTKRRLKYYRKWLKTDDIDLWYICDATDHDGDIEYYQKLVEKYL